MPQNQFIEIGYWRTSKDVFTDENSHYPAVEDYIQPGWWDTIYGCFMGHYTANMVHSKELKAIVIEYLNSFERINNLKGYSFCRVCDCRNGTAEQSDGDYLWPEGYTHYIKGHDVIVPLEIIRRAWKWKKNQ